MGLRLLIAAAALAAGCADVTLLECADADDCARAESALRAAGVATTSTTRGGHPALTVASDDVARAVTVLRALGTPDDGELPSPALFASAAAVRDAQARALERSLARTLTRDDAVLGARVHLSLVDTLSLSGDDDTARPTASVLLRTRANAIGLDDAAVRHLVAGAVAGMRPDDVTVVRTVARAVNTRPTHPALDARVRAALVAAFAIVAAVALWIARRALSTPAQRAGRHVDAQPQQVERGAGPVTDR